jgi:AraC family transcriptional regulator of adaptative response/methylated-DNA-[protein]-cysteine methyltransferase
MNNHYARIEKAIRYINANSDRQPSLTEVADHLCLSEFHFQRLFSRWAGISPKKYLQILTVEKAKLLLAGHQPTLETSAAVGLSSGSRLHDQFVNIEAVTPGEFKKCGAGMVINYSVVDSPFGNLFIAATERGICRMAFLSENNTDQQLNAEAADLQQYWPKAQLAHRPPLQLDDLQQLFQRNQPIEKPLSLLVRGTNFQVQVWRALLGINEGSLSSYGQIAEAIGRPGAARAVGSAIAANPVALLIPCHRVICQSGVIGGYRWGKTRKQAILSWELAP